MCLFMNGQENMNPNVRLTPDERAEALEAYNQDELQEIVDNARREHEMAVRRLEEIE